MNKHKSKRIVTFCFLLILLFIGIIYLFLPKRMITTLHLNDPMDHCFVLVNQIKEKETFAFDGEKLQEFYQLIAKTQVKFDGVYMTTIRQQRGCLYHLYFSRGTKEYDGFILDEKGYIYFKGIRYKIGGENATQIVSFLNNDVHNSPEIAVRQVR